MTSPLPGKPTSLWMDLNAGDEHPPLDRALQVDVCVIGAGITGLTTALLLRREGARVALLEGDRVATGVTGHTTAKVSSLHGTVYSELRRTFGAPNAATYAQAQEAAIARIADLVSELEIECGFRRRDAYTYVESADRRSQIEEEVDAATDAGLAAELVTETPLPYPVAAAVRLPHQAEFDARAYCLGLARAFVAADGLLFERTRAVGVNWRGGRRVQTEAGHDVVADDVVVATHFPILDRGAFFARMTQKRSYAIAVRPAGPVPDGMFISADQPTRSIRAHPGPDGEILLVGGESHTAGEHGDSTGECYERLAAFAAARFGATEVTHRWSAQDPMPADGVPYVGALVPASGGLHVATGFRKWGITNGTIAGVILTDRIGGRGNPFASLFDPNRLTLLRSAKGITSEMLKDARHFVGDRFAGVQDRAVEQLAPGEGALVKLEGETVAAHRTDDGELVAVSPTCTHLGCRVAWNVAERSWDCPCHGSRFAPDGAVLEGPAVRPLPRVALAAPAPAAPPS